MRKRSNVLKKRYALDILRSNDCSEGLIRHCLAVSKNAVEIASLVEIPVDKDLIKFGAILHDLGRCKTHGIEHAVVGGEIARSMGLPEEVANIIECHIGAGLTASEAGELGLPSRDFLPRTPEEKIVSYADNLTMGSDMGTFERALGKFKKIVGEGHPAVQRFISQHEEIMNWMASGVSKR